jgi:hypothetical protein
VQLTIDVADAHVIEIHQRKLADPRASQGLGRPGTDSPEPDYCHMRLPQSFQALAAEQSADPAETSFMGFQDCWGRHHSRA